MIQTTTAFQAHENKLYVETTQPNAKDILEQNKRHRLISKDHTTLRRGLNIPEEDFGMIVARYPDIVKGNRDEKKRAMTQIMADFPQFVEIEFHNKYHSVPKIGG